MRDRLSLLLKIIGALLILASAGLFLVNKNTEKEAGQASAQILQALKEAESIDEYDRPQDITLQASEEALRDYGNYSYSGNLSKESTPFVLKLGNKTTEEDAEEMDLSSRMPVLWVDGVAYIGTLDLPVLGLTFPVARDFDMDTMEKCPVVYYGNIYDRNAVICAHNYDTHFYTISNLQPGDSVTFEDVDSNVFEYQVTNIEYMNIDEALRMMTGDWDLTLFTCVRGQVKRIAVRCELVKVTCPGGEVLAVN